MTRALEGEMVFAETTFVIMRKSNEETASFMFGPEVPVDYMDGKPMKYRLNSDGQFLLYSAGEDGQDDNASLALRPGKSSERNPWDRKDFVWPAPATQQELDDYHRKGNK